MKPFLLSLPILFFLVFPVYSLDLESASAPFAGIDSSTLKERSYPIASPLIGGPLRILFFGEREETGFSVREVAIRLDCNVETLLTESRSRLGTREPWIRFRPKILSDSALSAKADLLLGKEWDVIWLDFQVAALPEPIRQALLARIKSGCGLVYVGNKGDVRSFVSGGKFDEKQLDMVSYGGTAKPLFAGFVGKGMVFILPNLDFASTIQDAGDYYARAVHTLILASGRQSPLKVIGIEKPSRQLELEAMSIMNFRIEMINSGNTSPRKVIVRYRDRNGRTAHESIETYGIETGKTFLRIRYPMLPVGRYSLDISVFEGETVAALAGTSINVISEETISDIVVWNQGVRVGKYVSGTIKTSRNIKEGMNMRAELLDQWGRQAGFSELQPVAGHKSVDFTFKISRPVKGSLTLRVTFYKNNIIDHILEKPVLTKNEYDPRRFSFIVGGDRSFKPWLSDGYDRLIEQGVNCFAWEINPSDPGPFYNTAVAVSSRGASVVPIIEASDVSGPQSIGITGKGAGKTKNHLDGITSVLDTLRNLDVPAYFLDAAIPDSLMHSGGVRLNLFTDQQKTGEFFPKAEGTFLTSGSGLLLSFSQFRQTGGMNCLLTGGESWRRGNEALLRATPWQSLFLGLNGIFWRDGFEGTGAALAPGLTITPAFSLMAEETGEIMSGIDLLLSGAERQGDRISESPVSFSDSSGNPAGGIQSTVYRDGKSWYIGLIADPGTPGIQNFQNRTILVKTDNLAKSAFIYDVREGVFMGGGNSFPVNLSPGEAKLFALLPYRVQDMDIKLKNNVINPGGSIQYQVKVQLQDAGIKPGRHIFQVSVLGPDGRERKFFSDSLTAAEGSMASSLGILPVDPHGKWKLKVKDISSGKSVEKIFMVMPGNK